MRKLIQWLRNPVMRANLTLTRAMRSDPGFAHSWQCNIAMTIYDGAKGKLDLEESNKIADRMMKHLFDVGMDAGILRAHYERRAQVARVNKKIAAL